MVRALRGMSCGHSSCQPAILGPKLFLVQRKFPPTKLFTKKSPPQNSFRKSELKLRKKKYSLTAKHQIQHNLRAKKKPISGRRSFLLSSIFRPQPRTLGGICFFLSRYQKYRRDICRGFWCLFLQPFFL